jgi:hypothetical protein
MASGAALLQGSGQNLQISSVGVAQPKANLQLAAPAPQPSVSATSAPSTPPPPISIAPPIAPPELQLADSSPLGDYQDALDNYKAVDLSLDPQTRQIQISAPDYYINSPEFKSQVLPAFQKLTGKAITTEGFQNLVNSDFVKKIQKQANTVGKRHQAIENYIAQYPDSTKDNALVYLRNASAAYQSDKDDTTQLVYGYQDDTPILRSVATTVEGFKALNDQQKASVRQSFQDIIDNPHKSPAAKAAARGMLAFAQGKQLLGARTGTKLERGLDVLASKFNEENPVGGLANVAEGLISKAATGNYQTASSRAEKQREQDPRAELPGANDLAGPASLIATGLSLPTNVVGGAVAGGLVSKLLVYGLGKFAKGAEVVKGVQSGLKTIEDSGQAGKRLVEYLKGVPSDIGFGATQDIENPGSFGPKELAENLLLSAAGLGAAKVAGRTLSHFPATAAGKTATTASENLGRALARGWEKIQTIPHIGEQLKNLSDATIDQQAAMRRVTRDAWAHKVTSTQQYKRQMALINSNTNKGAGLASQHIAHSEAFHRLMESQDMLASDTNSNLDDAFAYIDARNNINSPKITQSQREAYQQVLDAQADTPQYEQFYQDYQNYSRSSDQLAEQFDLSNEDIRHELEATPEFAGGFAHVQRDIQPPTRRPATASQKLKTNPLVKSRRGGTAPIQNPITTINDRIKAIYKLHLQNEVNKIPLELRHAGWSGIEVVREPAIAKAVNDLQNSVTKDKAAVTSFVEKRIPKFSAAVSKLLEDTEAFAGSDQVAVLGTVRSEIDNFSKQLATDPHIMAGYSQAKKLYEGSKLTKKQYTLETMSAYRQDIGQTIQQSLIDNNIPKEEANGVVDMFTKEVTARLDKSVARTGAVGGVSQKFQEIKKLNQELAPSNVTNNPDAVSYYEHGTQGYYLVADPELRRYFSHNYSPAHDNVFTKLATGAARGFRLATTGLNPVFGFVVNPTRDVVRGLVVSGPLSAPVVTKDLYEQAGVSAERAEQMVQEAQAASQTSTQIAAGRNTAKSLKDAAHLYDQGTQKKWRAALKQLKRNPLRGSEDLVNTIEVATRKAVYSGRFKQAIDRGLSPEDAHREGLLYAQEATGNFANVGGRVKSFVRTVPYLTAAINGKASFLRLAMLDPVGVASRLTAGVIMPMVYIYIHNLSTPENVKAYLGLSAYDRDNNLVVISHGTPFLIPLDQEIAPIIAPFRNLIEGAYHANHDSFTQTLAKSVLNWGGVGLDLSPLAKTDFRGQHHPGQALEQIASSAVPQVGKTAYEVATGRNMYTGAPLGPDDQQLLRTGQVRPGQDITNADRTFASHNSRILGAIANFAHIPQSKVQDIFHNFTGTVGGEVLNALDALIGAPAKERGGEGVAEKVANRFVGGTGQQQTFDYYDGIDQLAEAKSKVQTQLGNIQQKRQFADTDAEKQAYAQQRQKLINDYTQQVANFAEDYGNYYQRVGGFKPYQFKSLLNLLDLTKRGASSKDAIAPFAQSSHQSGDQRRVSLEGRDQAINRYLKAGLPATNPKDLYGQEVLDHNGNPTIDYSNTSFYHQAINNQIYNPSKQIAYEAEQLVKGNKQKGIPSLYQAEQPYYTAIDQLYKQAKGLDGQAAQAVYHKIAQVQRAYMRNVFDPRIKPLLDKYGPSILRNNSKLFDAISSSIMVPNDLTPWVTRKKQPYRQDDVIAYLQDRYGVGQLNRSNLPTGAEAQQLIKNINADLNQGHPGRAQRKFSGLQQLVNNRQSYVGPRKMRDIRTLIQAANSY